MSLKALPQNLLAPLPTPNAGTALRVPTPQAASLPGLIGDGAAPSGGGAPTEFSRLLERQRSKGTATAPRPPTLPNQPPHSHAASATSRAPVVAASAAPSSTPMRSPSNPSSAPGAADKQANATQAAASRARASGAKGADRAESDRTRQDATDTSSTDAAEVDSATAAQDPQVPPRLASKTKEVRADDEPLMVTAGDAAARGTARTTPGDDSASVAAAAALGLGRETASLRDSKALSDELTDSARTVAKATATPVDGRSDDARAPLSREDRHAAQAESDSLRLAALDTGASSDRAVDGSMWLAQAVRQGLGEGAGTSSARQGAVPLDGAAALGVPATGNALGGATSADSAVPLAPYVSTPLDDPGFREALGTQVSLLARDGVHSAELRLNPADMGPVSVQITMNGDQATVDFGADRAQTRQAIEAGWAELAASLRESGFTLSGGGVSSRHARDRDGGDDGARRTRGVSLGDAGADDSAGASQTVLRSRPRAGAALDLYA